jgi:hypothetical protein
MRLGIVTRYTAHEAAYAAITLANWGLARDLQVSIYPANQNPAMLERHWDTVVRKSRITQFSDWALSQEAILWTHCPHFEQLRWCSQQERRCVLFSLWHELDNSQRPVYQKADMVLSPSRIAARALQTRWQIGRSIPLPFSLGLPLFHKDPEDGPIRLLLPIFDGAARRMEMTILAIMERVLATMPHIELAIAYNASTLASYAYSKLQQLKRVGRERFKLLPRVAWKDRPLLFQHYDMTVWPTHAENTCIVGLMSLAMGAPLICFSVPPVDEIARAANSLLAPCGIDYGPHGAAVCRPDYAAFEEILHEGLKNRDRLHTLQQATSVGLADRQVDFTGILTRALGIS